MAKATKNGKRVRRNKRPAKIRYNAEKRWLTNKVRRLERAVKAAPTCLVVKAALERAQKSVKLGVR